MDSFGEEIFYSPRSPLSNRRWIRSKTNNRSGSRRSARSLSDRSPSGLGEFIYDKSRFAHIMCATCGCGINLGGIEDVFAKDYGCGDCGLVFKGFGYKVTCPRCKSTNTKRVR